MPHGQTPLTSASLVGRLRPAPADQAAWAEFRRPVRAVGVRLVPAVAAPGRRRQGRDARGAAAPGPPAPGQEQGGADAPGGGSQARRGRAGGPGMTACPAADALDRLLADTLTVAEAAGVEAHVERCRACQAELERRSAAPGPDAPGARCSPWPRTCCGRWPPSSPRRPTSRPYPATGSPTSWAGSAVRAAHRPPAVPRGYSARHAAAERPQRAGGVGPAAARVDVVAPVGLGGGGRHPGEGRAAGAVAKGGVGLVRLSVPEARALLLKLVWAAIPAADRVLAWSAWRRRHQYRAIACHPDAVAPDHPIDHLRL